MQKFFSYLAFILSVVIQVQSMAWATGSQTLEGKALVAKFVEFYNGLSDKGKVEAFTKMLAKRPEEDRAFIKRSLGDFSKIKFPELVQKAGSIVFTWQKHEVVITPVKGSLFNVNGVQVDAAPGKFSELEKHVDAIFPKKTVKLIDFLMAPAYAGSFWGGMVIAGIFGMILGLCMAPELFVLSAIGTVVAGFLAHDYKKQADAFEKLCSDLRQKLSNLPADASPDKILKAKQEISRTKIDLITDPRCSGGEYYAVCDRVRECLSSLLSELELYPNAVNEDARESRKEIEKASPKGTPKKDEAAFQ